MISAMILCLAITVQREAGGESSRVQQAVVDVIRNRSKKTHRPVCRIVREKRQFRQIKRIPRRQIIRAVKAAWIKPDITNGATHFHDPREIPKWAKKMKKTAQFGRLRFYR